MWSVKEILQKKKEREKREKRRNKKRGEKEIFTNISLSLGDGFADLPHFVYREETN